MTEREQALVEAARALNNWHNTPDQGNVFEQMRKVSELYAALSAALSQYKEPTNGR